MKSSNPINQIYFHRKILWRIARSDLGARYAGSVLGVGWAIISPLLILTIYSLVYLVIFRVRVPNLTSAEYVLFVFSGLVPYLMTAEAISSGVISVVANKDLLSNTVFPIALAPVKSILIAQMPAVVGFTGILIAIAITGNFSWTVIFLPLIWVLNIIALIGLLWILAPVNVVFRDIQNVISSILMILMIGSPIAYTPDMIPSSLKIIITLNPFAYYVVSYQRILIYGLPPTFTDLIAMVVIALILIIAGSFFFSVAIKGFVDHV